MRAVEIERMPKAHQSGGPLRLTVSTVDEPTASAFTYEFDADRTQILLGRRGGVDVLLPHARVSLVHARIERRLGDYLLSDESSTNGTRLNGLPIPPGQPRRLKDGDRIAIAGYLLQVSITDRRPDWPADASSSLARRMAREVLERLDTGGSHPALHVLDGPQAGVVLTLGEVNRTFVLGRAGRGDLRLDDVDMWRERAALVRDSEKVTVRELGPGTLAVNGERVQGERCLHDGDVLVFGGTSLRFVDPAEVYLRRLEALPDEPQPAAPAPAAPPVREGRPERWLAAFGVLVAVAAGGALIWVLLW